MEVAQDAGDDGRRIDRGDESEATSALTRALERVDVESTAHELGPGVVGARDGLLPRTGTRLLARLGDDSVTPLCVRREQTLVQDQVAAGRRELERSSTRPARVSKRAPASAS